MVAQLVETASPDVTMPAAPSHETLHDALAPHRRAAAITARLNGAHADLVDLVGELLATDGWAEPGMRSIEHWLVVRAGLSAVQAREVAVVARRLPELPDLARRMHAGRLTIGQCAAVADHVPATHQRITAQIAEATTVPQLRRLLARYSFDGPFDTVPVTTPDKTDTADSPEPYSTEPGSTEPGSTDADSGTSTAHADEQAGAAAAEQAAAETRAAERAAKQAAAVQKAQAPARLRMYQGLDGRFHLSFDAPTDQGALLHNALREAKDALFNAGDPEVTLGDAMIEIASRSLATITSPQRASHYRVYVHLAADSPTGWVNGGGAITPALAALFACDATLNPVIERAATPVSVGRRMRIVPARTRRLIEDRDRGCTYPGCPSPSAGTGFLQIHHITAWADSGSTDLHTNIALCPHHHRTTHTGAIRITGNPDLPPGTLGALTFTTRHGLPIRPPQPSDATPPDDPGTGIGIGIGIGTISNPWTNPWTPPTGETMHLHWVDLPSDAYLDDQAERDRNAPWRTDHADHADDETGTDHADDRDGRSPPGPISIVG